VRRAAAPERLFAGCRTGLTTAALFSLGINLLMLTSAFYMFQVFDRVLASRSTDTLLHLTLIALAALATLGLLDMIRGRMLVRLGGSIERRMGPAVLARSVDMANSGQAGGADRLADLNRIRSFFSSPAILAIFDTPWVPIYLVAIYLLHPYLGHFTLAGAALLFALALLNERLAHKRMKQAAASAARVQRRAEGIVRNAAIVDALGILPDLCRRWSRGLANARLQQLRANDRSSVIVALAKFSRMALQVAILGLGAYLVIQHEITAGAMIAASILLGRALAPIEQANAHLRQAIGTWDAARRLQSFFDAPARRGRTMPLPAPSGHLVLSQVSYVPAPGRAAKPQPILSGVSFEAQPGELIAVVGPSAAGKSTLARLLVGIQPPSAGTVRLDGADVFAWDRAEFGRHVGYLPQELELFSGSVKDNIARMGDPEASLVAEAARMAGCHEMILKLPEGYESEIGEGGLFLSGGQRQRIALARAFYGRPKLLVLDEPDASLDAEGDAALGNALVSAKGQGSTVIVVAHRPNVLARADKILILRDGKVDLFGPRAAVSAELARRGAQGRSGPYVVAPSSAAPRIAQAPTGADQQNGAAE
jgi:PrtD family type I secretion system ABC transporter